MNFSDPVSNESSFNAQYISNKYNVRINPLYFEWHKFIPTLERQFPDVLNKHN